MKNTFHNIDPLFRLPFFAVLGLAVFFGGCSYSYTAETAKMGHQNVVLREHVAFKWTTPDGVKRYAGPQNTQKIMKAFDASYNRGRSKIEVSVSRKVAGIKITDYSSKLTMSEIDMRYPRAEWLQLLLDSGITIKSFNEYAHYMLKRHTLTLLEDNPKLWESGILDIPPTADWKTYKAAYINQLVKEHVKTRKTEEQIERSKKEIELTEAQLERSKEQLELAQKQLEHIQGTLVHPKAPIPPQVPTPPKVPKRPQEPN